MVLSYASKNFLHKQALHVAILQHKYDVANYNRILFSDMKLSKKFCVHRIEHESVLLTVEEHYSFMSVHQIHKLLKM